MKTSEVLERALRLLGENGEHWVNRCPHSLELHCAVTALVEVSRPRYEGIHEATRALKTVTGATRLAYDWNDKARDFSEIRAGFLKAIELAKQQEQANDN